MLSNDEVATELQCDQVLKVLYDFMWKTIKLNDEAITCFFFADPS